MTTLPPNFERIPAPLRDAIVKRGFTELTTVQIAALDAIDASRDLRITSQTGSGKTVALGLAIGPELLDDSAAESRRGPAAIVIVPTRELAAQVHKELEWLYADVRDVNVDSVTGGTHVGRERHRLSRHPRVLVGTPGRLLDHIRTGALKTEFVHQLVLDEADQMLDMGFREELEGIVNSLPSEGRRTHLMSATFPRGVQNLANGIQDNPLHVQGTQLGAANEDIAHIGHVVHARDRYGALVNMLLLAGKGERALVFVATRNTTVSLAEQLSRDGFSAMPLSGDLVQAQRTRTLDAFRSGAIEVIVATDVAARGIDVPELANVTHFDLPMDGEVYTHRSGRCGRAGNKGRSVVLATPNAERRARRIFSDARVQAEWQSVPSGRDVERALLKRARRQIRKNVEEPVKPPSEAELEFAKSLLEGLEPAEVVARLIGRVSSDRPRDPFDLSSPASRPGRGGPRPERSGPPLDGNSFTRFRINWGFRSGANPNRLLAAICRRGDVSSREVGRIHIEANGATFDIANDSAGRFEKAASRRDDRDPNQRIERDQGMDPGFGRGGAGGGRPGGYGGSAHGSSRPHRPRPRHLRS